MVLATILIIIVESLVGGKFSEVGELSVFHQTKTIQISTYD